MNTDLSAYLIPYHGLRPSCSPKPMLHSFQRKYFTSIESMPDIEDEEFSELLKSLILISNAYIQNFKISTYVPYAMEQAFENDMRNFSEWFAENIAEAYQKSLNQGFDVHKAMQSAAEQAERGLSSLVVKLERYDNEIKTFNTFDYYWDQGYTRCLFVSEQGEHTCDMCQSYHGKVLSSREVPIPPLHPHCRCELILLDARAESLYYMNRRGFLEAFQRARRGPAGGLFLLDHDFLQDGMKPSSLTRLTLPNGHVVIDVYAPPIDNSDEQYYQYMERWAGTYFAGLVCDANKMLEALLQVQDERSRHKWDSLGAFFDWVTLGIVSGTWQVFVDRHMAMVENPSFYNILNAVLLGLPDQLKDTFAPEEPWSLEHWLNIIETALLVYSAYKISVSVKNALAEGTRSTVGRQALIDEVIAIGYKITPDNVVWIMKTTEGKIVWLETGTARAGLQHILTHASQFVQNGIAVEDISEFIKYAITNGKIVGMQGTRPIYEVTYQGIVQRVAIQISDNGFIVGANPNHH